MRSRKSKIWGMRRVFKLLELLVSLGTFVLTRFHPMRRWQEPSRWKRSLSYHITYYHSTFRQRRRKRFHAMGTSLVYIARSYSAQTTVSSYENGRFIIRHEYFWGYLCKADSIVVLVKRLQWYLRMACSHIIVKVLEFRDSFKTNITPNLGQKEGEII
jgi:hypothetical protein